MDVDLMAELTTYQSGIERQRALECIEETIVLTGRLGVDAKG
jgi:hypothetical protein